MTRFFDILFSGIAIVILFPFMIPIVIGLKLTGEHDIFYGQSRVGRYGKEFKLLKFATMLRNSPNMQGGLFTSENDPRMLPMGKFLRRTKINELPQLLNIFAGQMSVIGFRPTVKKHYDLFTDEAKRKLYNARPGLSGIGSVVFRNEEQILQNFEDKERFHAEVIDPYKIKLECWYEDHRSVVLYFKLIFLTVEAVLNPSSKKWRTAFHDLPAVPQELEKFI